MKDFPEFLRFNIETPVNNAVNWLLLTFGGFFDIVKDCVLWLLMQIEGFLIWLPWWLIIAVVIYLGWRATGRLRFGLIMGALMLIIGCFGLWDRAMQTVAIVTGAVFISLALGIPLGIWMAWNNNVESCLRPLLDAMQTMPSFVYLIPAMMFFSLGKVPALFATTIYAIPPIIRLTNLGVRQVPEDVVEAGRAFGSTRLQILFKIQMPLAMPSIMSGVNQTTMMALAMVVLASMIGAQGLGEPVLIGLQRVNIGQGFEAGLSIVILAIIIDRILQGFGQKRQTVEPSA
ncbi:MAG: proline/glycine betaine ABC transporter permease [Candidatus Desulforudis sp.]|nr:proline/glycine betaine ABC transporter permease [Desulforudis sp.]